MTKENLVLVDKSYVLSDYEEENIKMYRLQGKTIKEIADMFGCSVGLIRKLIKEN